MGWRSEEEEEKGITSRNCLQEFAQRIKMQNKQKPKGKVRYVE